jgi:hypothetical protein
MARMKHRLPPLTTDLIEAFTASALLWLGWVMGVILRIGPARRSRRLRRFVEVCEREVESILFLKAVHRFGPPPPRRGVPGGAPPGFRRNAERGRMRLFFRNSGVCARKAGLGERVARLAAALANPEPFVAYFFKRLLRGLRGPCLTPVAPPAYALGLDAPQRLSFADTS